MNEQENKQQLLDWCCAVLRQTLTCADLERIDYIPNGKKAEAVAVWSNRKQRIDITGLNEFGSIKKIINSI